MNSLINDLREVERAMSSEHGEFALFACFLPADAQDQWDLVVSAPWAPRNDRATLNKFVKAVDARMAPSERLLLSRIVIVEPSDPDVQTINSRFTVQHDLVEVRNEQYFGFLVDDGFIVTSTDYWRFVKQLFPRDAAFVFFREGGDLHIRVSWKLKSDPDRPNKSSRSIIIRISHEALDDYLYVDHPRRRLAERKLVAFLKSNLRSFNPEHSVPRGKTPPEVEWLVSTTLFEDEAAHG